LKHKKTGLKGYLTVDLFINGKHNYKYVHKLLAETFKENPNKLKFVVHKDGNVANNNLKNLQWSDAVEKGKIQRQNLVKKLKVNDMATKKISNTVLADIAYFRVLRKNEVYLSKLHEIFNVSAMTIGAIKSNITKQKKDLMIIYQTENCYRVSVRKKFLLFFNRWVPLTYQEAENSSEIPLEFKSFSEAQFFIENIAE